MIVFLKHKFSVFELNEVSRTDTELNLSWKISDVQYAIYALVCSELKKILIWL
jgi:hypothetical protein